MKLMKQLDGHILSRMPSAEQTQNWHKAKWIDALRRSTDKPRIDYCGDQNGTLMYSTRPQPWCHSQFNLILFETYSVEWERTHIPHGQFFQLQTYGLVYGQEDRV